MVLLDNNNFPTLKFNSTGPNAGGPAEWINNQGKTVPGSVTGSIDPNGAINLTYQDNNTEDAGFVGFNGNMSADGKASGSNWHASTPLTCVTKAPLAGPTIALDPGIGSLTIHITDHSGVASNCQYNSDFVNRKFHLSANGTADINVVPAVPLFIDHQVDITCDNGTGTHTSAFF